MRSQIIYRRPADLKPRPNNPRTHTDRQIQQIAQSIRTFEFLNPVLIDGKHPAKTAGEAFLAQAA
jgi:ParB-like chromosome segregation protein Spo0J